MRDKLLQRIGYYKSGHKWADGFKGSGRWRWDVNGVRLKDVDFATLDDDTLLNTFERIIRSWNKWM